MKRGRKPSPHGLHLVLGTDRSRGGTRSDAQSDGPPTGAPAKPLPAPPKHLKGHARAFWRDAARELEALGLGTSADQWDLEAAALLYQRARVAEERSPEGGFYTCAKTGNPKRHPAAVEALQARKELRILLEAMGLSAPGRVRLLGSVKPRNADGDPEETFFTSKPGRMA